MSISVGGFFSGLDTSSIVSQLTALNRIPINLLEIEKSELNTADEAYGFVDSSLESLKDKLSSVDDASDFDLRTVSTSVSTVGTASVTSSAEVGSFSLEITQVATASTFTSGKSSAIPAATDTVSNVFGSTAVGTFTINNVEITLDGTEQLDDGASTGLVGKINQALTDAGESISIAYASGTGLFTITSSSQPLIVSSGTSDFLQQAQLFNNASTSITSSNSIGRINASSALSGQSLAASLTSSGSIVINGVEVSYTDTDTLQNVLDRITLSNAGVAASYDNYNDQVIFTAKDRGSNSITVANGTTGNLVEALNLNSGTLAVGQTTKFKVDGGAERESQDQTLTELELGKNGVTFNAIETGTTTLTTDVDVTGIRNNIESLIEQYNGTQNLVDSYIRIDTNDITNSGTLSAEGSLTFLPQELRDAFLSTINPTSGASIVTALDLGIESNSDDNTVTLSDSTALENALRDNLDEVISLFTDFESGIANAIENTIEAYATGIENVIENRREAIDDEIQRIDDEIELTEARVEAERVFLESQFALLEQTQAQTGAFGSILSSSLPPT
ncbi:MAG: flagellar filament capping protein FliD [Verrucomicrobiota bacterium]